MICITFLKTASITSKFRYSPDNIYLLSAFFALFIFTSVLHCFNARTDRIRLLSGLGKNKAFIGIMILVCAVQLLFVYLGGNVLRTVPLMPEELATTGLLALAVIPADLLRKIFRRMCGKKDGF